jgi:hypothetical protein
LLDPCSKINLCIKNTQNIREEKKLFDWKKKLRSKDIYYSNVKPKQSETNYKFLHRSTSSIECVVYLYSVSSINNQTRYSIVVLTRPTSRKSQKNLSLVGHNNLLRLHGYEKLYSNYKVKSKRKGKERRD